MKRHSALPMFRAALAASVSAVAPAALSVLAGAAPAVAYAQAPTVSGEITKLDKAGGRVTLKHGDIKNLDMPPMTMSFRVRQPQLLEGMAVGDRVRFVAERIEGQYTVTALSKAP